MSNMLLNVLVVSLSIVLHLSPSFSASALLLWMNPFVLSANIGKFAKYNRVRSVFFKPSFLE